MNSSKKQTNEFIFTSMRRVFVRFLEEIEDFKKAFQNYLTFTIMQKLNIFKFAHDKWHYLILVSEATENNY